MAKTASLDSDEFSELPDSAFAWPGQRCFPIHNREHVAISYGYSKLASHVPSDVQETLDKAAELYGIDTETVYSTTEKVAAEDKSYYLLPEIKRLKIASLDDIPVMERVYHEKYPTLSVEDRAEAGMRLVKIAKENGVPLTPSTHKLAGFTITDTAKLRDWVGARKMAAHNMGSMVSEAYQTLENGLAQAPAHIADRDAQVKVASLLHDLDKDAGLTQFYGKKLPDPLRTVFNTDKLAEDHVKIGSALQNKQLIASLPLEFWVDALGEDVAKEIAPNGTVDTAALEAILPTLPDDMKATLETQLAAYNK